MGFPQVEWVLLVVSCIMKALVGMGVSAAGNNVLWVVLFKFSFEAEVYLLFFFFFVKVTELSD